jgi:hypothetical protein
MSLPELRSIVIASVLVAGCATGGLEYWLYPEPHLPPGEDAVMATYETNRLLLLDEEDAATMCWGDRRMATQAYRRNDRICRLHIRPGRHSAVFQTGMNLGQQVRLEFTAVSGRIYGLRRFGCASSSESIQQNCRFEIVEVGDGAEGG